MVKVKDKKLTERFFSEHKLDTILGEELRPYVELFLYKKNEHICRQNEEINYLYFFVHGKVKVYDTLSNGRSLLLCFYESLRVIGDLELINSKLTISNIQAVEDSYCIAIAFDKMKKSIENDSRFLRYICNSLGDKLNQCSKNSSINLLFSLENRLASYILGIWEGAEDMALNENLTEISELLGTSYRHLLRTLKSFYSKGFIEKCKDGFKVRDKDALRNLAADLYK